MANSGDQDKVLNSSDVSDYQNNSLCNDIKYQDLRKLNWNVIQVTAFRHAYIMLE